MDEKKNSLVLNPEKSQQLLIGSPHLVSESDALELTINGRSIKSAGSLKNLGLYIDSNLKFERHVSEVCRKVYLSLKRLYRFQHLLNTDTKKMIVNSLVFPHFHYADVVYGPCLTNESRNRLQRMQNNCIRFITRVPRFSHVTPIIRELSLLRLNESRFIHFVCFTFSILCKMAPKYLSDRLVWRGNIHERSLRRVNSTLDIPCHRSSMYRSSFSFLAPYVYNKISVSFPGLKSKLGLKRRLKQEISKNTEILDFNLF